MTPIQVLRKARRLVVKGWTRGASARNSHGTGVPWQHPSAVRFCAIGAICRAGRLEYDRDQAAIALSSVVGRNIILFNDAPGRTKAQVLAAFDRAIEGLQ